MHFFYLMQVNLGYF